MDNPETQATLCTRHRTKTEKAKIKKNKKRRKKEKKYKIHTAQHKAQWSKL